MPYASGAAPEAMRAAGRPAVPVLAPAGPATVRTAAARAADAAAAASRVRVRVRGDTSFRAGRRESGAQGERKTLAENLTFQVLSALLASTGGAAELMVILAIINAA
jgi:hypothetical protein